MMHNRWRGGPVHIEVPWLPPERRNRPGTWLQRCTIDPRVGEEVALVILDDPEFAKTLGKLNPFRLFATAGLVRTSAGPIAYIIWTVSSGSGHVVDYEHTLDPFNDETIRLIADLSEQTHLKVLIVESCNSDSVGFFENPNDYDLAQLGKALGELRLTDAPADFGLTQAALGREFTLEQLKRS